MGATPPSPAPHSLPYSTTAFALKVARARGSDDAEDNSNGALTAVRTSLGEQLAALRGVTPAELPAPLLAVAVRRVELAGCDVSVLLPADWDALRHEEGAAGRPVPYWARPWPSGLALAAAVDAAAPAAGSRVLELGCGLAIPSIVAAVGGADVLATDGATDAVAFAAHSMALNDVEGDVAHADWTAHGDVLAERGPFDLVLAADVLYTRANVEAALRLFPRLLAPGGEPWLADPGRTNARDYLAAARATFEVSRAGRAASHPVPAASSARTARSVLQQLEQPRLVEHGDAEPLGLLELRAGRGARDHVARLLGHRAGDLAALGDDPLGRLLAGEVGQRAGEHERLLAQRALARRRALLLELQPERAQVLDQLAHLRVRSCEWMSCGDLRADAGRLGDLLGRGVQQRVDRAELRGEVAAGHEADALDAGREQHDARTAAPWTPGSRARCSRR